MLTLCRFENLTILTVPIKTKSPRTIDYCIERVPTSEHAGDILFTTLQPSPSRSCFFLYSGTLILLLRYPVFKVHISPI